MTTTQIATLAQRMTDRQPVTFPAMTAKDLGRLLELLKAART
jgi:hypothetical protein